MRLFMKRSEGTTDEHFMFWRKMIDQWFNGGDNVVMDFGKFDEVKKEIQEIIDGQKIDRDKLNTTL